MSARLFETTVADAVTHHRAGRLAEAEAGYRAALALVPGAPAVLHNLGVVLAARGLDAAALSAFDAAIAAEPGYATAHYNRGIALQQLGRASEALAAYEHASRIEPGHYGSHRALGFLWLAQGNRDRALDHFARTCELRRGDDRTGIAERSLVYASRAKLLHDAAQLRYLSGLRRDGQRFEMMARNYEEVARTVPDVPTRLSAAQLDMLGEDYNAAINVKAAPELTIPTISDDFDRRTIAREFHAGSAGVTIVDGLLSPPALAGLRRYLLESTIWHDFEHIGDFVATYLEDGLACPLVLQIADELRQALPEVLGPHPLSQAWAFKGLEATASVAAHADDAAVSVNLWVTPETANLDPGYGGLAVCRVPPPPGWEIAGYQADHARVAAHMATHAAQTVHVPYAQNRAVMFESRLFHRSDAPHFATGYETRRINVTLLFGRHELPHSSSN